MKREPKRLSTRVSKILQGSRGAMGTLGRLVTRVSKTAEESEGHPGEVLHQGALSRVPFQKGALARSIKRAARRG